MIAVVTPSEDPSVASPFSADSAKLTGMLSSIPPVHHSRTKRPRRTQEESGNLPLVTMVGDVFETGYMNNGQTMAMTMQMTPITGMSMMQMQPVQVQSVQMQMLPQMQILSQMQVMPESLQEVNQESQQSLPTDLQNHSETHELSVEGMSSKHEPEILENEKGVTFHLSKNEADEPSSKRAAVDLYV